MALFDFLNKKKPAPAEPFAPPMAAPTDQVISMQQQGLTNNQIVQALQRQGYDTGAIMDAMQQVGAKHDVEPYVPEEMPPAPAPSTQHFEEIAEHIVDEKWQEFTKEMSKMSEWKDTVNSRLDRLEQSMNDAKADLDNLHKAIISKIGEYDKNLLDVGTEIKAMEKVFQKVLPTLTENVSELARVTKNVKSAKK
ncbi:MAG TPA: hypothetical protein VLJ21_03875 [Candidatus Binatia bacterium]|nr:hypothetical protein [Candidatus Binatia bacterium]